MTALAVAPGLIAAVEDAARAAAPKECCGLLLGSRAPGRVTLARAVASPNRAARPRRGFEIDPQLWLDHARAARTTRGAAIVGLYHSHPGGAAEPSARDLAEAWGEGTVWLITAFAPGRAPDTAAFLFTETPRRRFVPLALPRNA